MRASSGTVPEALFQRLIEAGDPVCLSDARGQRLYANPAFERVVAAAAPLGIDPVHSDTAELSLVIDERTVRFAIHRDAVFLDETEFMVTRLVPVGETEALRDALADAVERLEDITRLVSDWIWETNRNLVLTMVSPRVSEALGYHQIELTGRRLNELPTTPHPLLDELAGPSGRRPFREIAVEIADRSGKTRHFLLSGLPVYCRRTGDFLGYRGTA
ncbi:MAG: PAS domain S-box protein, partial [Alphaproteobacteria bacterium]